jgi:Fe-S-cluster containining protein
MQARPGARFTCHGDGLCCTDIHQLGPVSAKEKPPLDAVRKGIVVREGNIRLLRLVDDHRPGGCTFLDEEMMCEIHTHDEGRTKPRTCHRFPFLLAKTPEGHRLGTDHRCPCRTMGERELVDVAHARASLLDTSGRLTSDRKIEDRIALAPKKHVEWSTYRNHEAYFLERLDRCSEALQVEDALEAEAFPDLALNTWSKVAEELKGQTRSSRWGECFRLFGRTLAWLTSDPEERGPLKMAPRLWEEAFDRAEKRTAFDPKDRNRVIEAMFADFAADAIWALDWPFFHSLLHTRIELATRFAVARAFIYALEQSGVRPDRAAAEAIAMIEVVGVSPEWLTVIMQMRMPELPKHLQGRKPVRT